MKRWNLRAKYGVYDRYDDCWIGSNENSTGPMLYDELNLAVLASRARGFQYDQFRRYEARPFPGSEAIEFRDEIEEPISMARKRFGNSN